MWKRTAAVLMLALAFGAGITVALLWRSAGLGRVKVGMAGPTASAPHPGSAAHQDLWTCGMHPQVIQDHPGTCPICHMRLTPLKSEDAASEGGAKERKVAYWWDPMLGPASISATPGKSAMGMNLVPVYEQDLAAGPKVTIDPTVVQNMGVRTAKVTRGPLEVTVRAVGMLKPPESELHDVTLKVAGFVEKLYANTEGMHVQKGEVLFDLYSPELQVAEQELITAVRALKSLDAGAGDPVRREAEGLVESARRKLLLWDVAAQDVEAIARADQPPRTVPFRSPAAGAIVEKAVVQGSAVQAGMKLMRIEGHTTLWLDAQVYEEQMSAVSVGQTVESTVAGMPGKTFTGTVTFIDPHVDPVTRTETVRTTLGNSDMTLKPGMYATVKLVGRPVADAVLVPRESVIDTGTRQIAFVAEPDGHYDPRHVKVGLAGDEDRLQILAGLAPGERVVTSGQFLMDVESRTTEAIQKLRRGAPLPVPTSGPQGAGERIATAAEPAASRPATLAPPPSTGAAQPLVVANCPMKKADWLQAGEQLANPYYGSSMSTCGEVKRTLPFPRPGSPMAPVASAYLVVQRDLNAGKLDPDAIRALRRAAQALPAGEYTALKNAAAELAAAEDLPAARAAFTGASAEVIAALDGGA